MSRTRQVIGSVIAIVAFILTTLWVIRLHWRRDHQEDTVLRIAHVNSFSTVRGAFDRVAREYEQLHPGVRIEQILVPTRTYTTWLRTRLVGDVAPDIVEMKGDLLNEDHVRFFRELTHELNVPNPYNQGTPLANVRWRDTFLTGIQERPNYVEALLAFYSVPSSFATYRLIYNRDLLEKTFGQTEPPKTAYELAALCEEISRRSQEEKLGLVPIAIENENGRLLLEDILRSATKETMLQIDPYGHYWNWDDEIAVAYLLGRWSFQTPEVRAGLESMSALGRELPQDFLQVGKGEGTFSFMQGKAVFLVTPSFEYTMFRASCPFPLGVARTPVSGNDPTDITTEGNIQPAANLGVVRTSSNAELAVDFLRFLGSQHGNRIFSETSLWLPSIKGISPPAALADFAPLNTGRPPGLSLWVFRKSDHIDVNRHLHRLIGPHGSADKFIQALEPEFAAVFRRGLLDRARLARMVGQRFDSVLGAHDRLAAAGDRTESPERNPARILEVQTIYESRAAYYDLVLDATDPTPAAYFAPLAERPSPIP